MNAVFKKISGVLQILKNAIEKKISGVLQIMHLELTFSREKIGTLNKVLGASVNFWWPSEKVWH